MKMNPIYVTKSYVPPLKEYIYQLDDIWKSGNFSNGGEKNCLFTKELKKYLNVENIILTPNGTLPLQIAIKQFSSKNKNEIITTPFSYVATTSSIFWENCKPIFVDINSKYLTIDENLIEKKLMKIHQLYLQPTFMEILVMLISLKKYQKNIIFLLFMMVHMHLE